MSRVGGLNAECAFYIWVADLSMDLFSLKDKSTVGPKPTSLSSGDFLS
jgi:hypothetical protein